MLKKNKVHIIITTILVLMPMLVGFLLWDQLPDQIATHFNAQGVPDGWSSKLFAVVGLPGIMTGIHLICIIATLADPRKQNIQNKIFRMVLWITPLISAFVMGGVYLYGLGYQIDMAKACMGLISVVFIVIGNYLPKCRQNYTIGIKVPWTLADEDNWNKTHRFAGWLWTGVGILLLGLAAVGKINMIVMVGLILCVSFIPMGYSFWYYVKNGKKKE